MKTTTKNRKPTDRGKAYRGVIKSIREAAARAAVEAVADAIEANMIPITRRACDAARAVVHAHGWGAEEFMGAQLEARLFAGLPPSRVTTPIDAIAAGINDALDRLEGKA